MNPLIVLASSVLETYEFNYSFASLLLYDHILCIGEEVEYFWTGPWSLSRFLYFLIRYMALGFALFSVITQKWTTNGFHEIAFIIKICVFVLPLTFLSQSVITLRIWFLFSRNLVVRNFAVALLLACTTATVFLSAALWKTIQFSSMNPLIPASPMTALLYVPSLALHTILFALKVYRFLSSSVKAQTDSFLWRFLKEGMFMYACASVSLLLGVVSLTMVEPSQLTLRAPAIASSPIIALIVISVCRAMLNIRSVAATSHVDPEWLLSHAELSRVHWRRGSVAGEIVVEASELADIPLDSNYL